MVLPTRSMPIAIPHALPNGQSERKRHTNDRSRLSDQLILLVQAQICGGLKHEKKTKLLLMRSFYDSLVCHRQKNWQN
jgi:hypothetical protein